MIFRYLPICLAAILIIFLPYLNILQAESLKKSDASLPKSVWMADSVNNLINSNPRQALEMCFEILRLPDKALPDTIKSNVTIFIGYILDKQGFPVQALSFYKEANRLLDLDGRKSRSGYLQIDMGNLYFQQGDWEDAIKKYREAESLFLTENNWAGYYTAVNNLGLVEQEIGNYSSAKRFFFQALTIPQEKLDYPYLFAHSYQYIGDCYHAQGLQDSALYYYHRVLEVKVKDSKDNLAGLIHQKAAAVHLENGDSTTALKHLRLAESDFLQNKNIFYLAKLYPSLAELYFTLEMADSGWALLTRAWQIAEAEAMIRLQIQLKEKMIQFHHLHGNEEDLIPHLESLASLWKERYETEMKGKLLNLDIQSLVLEYQKTLALTQQELRHTRLWRNGAIFAGSIFLLLLILLARRYIQNKRMHHQIISQEREIHQQELEIESLKHEQANRELVCMSAAMQQQSASFEKIMQQLEKELPASDNSQHKLLVKTLKSINETLEADENWKRFESQFVKVFPGFLESLLAINPNLTTNDLKICAYHRMNLDTKEIAAFTGLSPRTIQTNRYRLKKKLDIPEDTDFQVFINTL
jgi:tetratricopeptide (TPR) repeat protein